MGKKKFGIRWQLLAIMLPISIIPIIIIVAFTTSRIFTNLEERSKDFYLSVMQMLVYNIDNMYEQYGRTLTNASKIPNVEQGLLAPAYESKSQEIQISNQITGRNVIVNGNRVISDGLRKTFEEKIEGDLFVVELDKRSLVEDSKYKIHLLSQAIPTPNVDLLMDSPIFQKVKSNNEIKLIIGLLDEKILRTLDDSSRASIIFPYYKEPPENPEDTFTKFFLISFHQSFIKQLYSEIEHIKSGTLYMLDQFDNVVTFNHPDYSEDYYDYDEEKGQYVLGDNPLNDPFEIMSFKEYKLLNTDKNILKEPKVQKVLQKLTSKYFYDDDYVDVNTTNQIIRYKGVDYLMVSQFCPTTEFKLVYFHPIYQVRKPVYFVFWITIILTVFITLVVLVLSLFFSRTFTKPIQTLAISAGHIASGDYDNKVDTRKFFGEFVDLGNSFNEMASQIQEYNIHLEDLVAHRTMELARANAKMLSELAVARKIQQAIIPKNFPEIIGLKMYGFYRPMTELGGDFYDVFVIDNENVAFLIIDVCGHGVAAALITAMAKVSFFNNAKSGMSTKEIVDIVNKEICNVIGENNTYFTAFLGVYNTKTHKLQYSNAGHCEIILVKKSKDIQLLSCNSMFVGMMKTVIYESDEVEFNSGDRLVLYTDGIIETRDANDQLFGLDNFKQILIQCSEESQQQCIDTLVKTLDDYRGDSEISDDVTILTIDIC